MRPLYAVAVERFRYNRRTKTGNWVPDIDYLHADSIPHARAQFCYREPNRRVSRIVGVAPVIGYYVEDKEGKILSV